MKAVILIGTSGTLMCSLANFVPKHMFRVGNKPLLEHLLFELITQGITEVALISSPKTPWDETFVQNLKTKFNIPISFYWDDGPNGTAGSLREINDFLVDSDFLVLDGNIFIESLSLKNLLRFHKMSKAGLTAVVIEKKFSDLQFENIEIDKRGKIKKVHLIHHSQNNRRRYQFSGIYLFSPSLLKYISESGYMDIKEQLLSCLRNHNVPVFTFTQDSIIRKITNVEDYFRVNRNFLCDDFFQKSPLLKGLEERGEGILVGKNVKIAHNALLIAPVQLGDGCVVEEGCKIIGPVSIGDNAKLLKGAMVHESIVWEKTILSENSCTKYSIVTDQCVIPKDRKVQNSIVIHQADNKDQLDFLSLSADYTNNLLVHRNASLRPLKKKVLPYNKAYLTEKRALDLLLSLFALISGIPLFICIAIAIKLNSKGPVFYSQKRCSRDGKGFKMYKFRTMLHNAEEIHSQLIPLSDIDGPMFKMKEDPRITRVGAFLRKTSLDELPQLLNTLKGEMSLVGPRPLVMEEMKYSPNWRDIRLKVRPGITGLWQISGRSEVGFHEWINHDIEYVKTMSFRLDLKILWKTISSVFRGDGAA